MKQDFLLKTMEVLALAAVVICCITSIRFSPGRKYTLSVAKVEGINSQNITSTEKDDGKIYHNMKDNVIIEPNTEKMQETMQEAPHFPMNINDADKEALMRVKGIGEKRASDILDYRAKKGRIQKMEELLEIKGIGEKTLENLCRKFYAE